MRPKSIQKVLILVGFAPVVAQIVSWYTEAREVLILVSSQSAEGRGCGSGEGLQRVGVVVGEKRVWTWFVCIYFFFVLCKDLADSGCAVKL